MEKRFITISFNDAKKWYKGDNTTLKELALQAFNEEELQKNHYTNIKCFEDAVKALNLGYNSVITKIQMLEDNHLKAIYKLDIIKKALNGNWTPLIEKGDIYFPNVEIYPNKDIDKISNKNRVIEKPSIYSTRKYILVGGDVSKHHWIGLCAFENNQGCINPYLGLLGCKSEEIAMHMSKYFAKEIFDAVYIHYNNYKWIYET